MTASTTLHRPTRAPRVEARGALEILERTLAERPKDPFPPISDVVRALIRARDAMIAEGRVHGKVHSRLAALNGVIGVGIGAQFPVVGVKWDRIEKLRDALRDWLAREDD